MILLLTLDSTLEVEVKADGVVDMVRELSARRKPFAACRGRCNI